MVSRTVFTFRTIAPSQPGSSQEAVHDSRINRPLLPFPPPHSALQLPLPESSPLSRSTFPPPPSFPHPPSLPSPPPFSHFHAPTDHSQSPPSPSSLAHIAAQLNRPSRHTSNHVVFRRPTRSSGTPSRFVHVDSDELAMVKTKFNSPLCVHRSLFMVSVYIEGFLYQVSRLLRRIFSSTSLIGGVASTTSRKF